LGVAYQPEPEIGNLIKNSAEMDGCLLVNFRVVCVFRG
jgi:hypothetical protein